MNAGTIGLLFWIVIAISALFWTRRIRHPDSRPLAVWLMFLMVFTAVAATVFGLATLLLAALGGEALIAHPLGAILFLVAVFAPACLVATWVARRPPRQAPLPPG